MKTFNQWCEDNSHELPTFNDAPEAEANADAPKEEKPTSEKGTRTGYSGNYPASYVSGQYPAGWFTSRKATAFLDAENMKKNKKK